MYKIVVASHGKFSEGCLDTIKFFIKDTENISTLVLDNDGIENLKSRLKNYLMRLKTLMY